MDLLKTLVLYMTMVFASSVQTMPDAEGFMVAYTTPAPTAVVATAAPVATPTPTPVPTVQVSPNPEYKTLQVGDKGEAVLKLQQALAEYGYYDGEQDGRYGNQTRMAVERFQYNHGLYADGIAGKYTLSVLYDSQQVRYAEATPTPPPPADTLTAAQPAPETQAPAGEETPLPAAETPVPATETPAPEATPEPTIVPEATAVPETTEAAQTTAAPVFEAMEGWVIRLADTDLPLVTATVSDKEAATEPVLPYRAGDTLYLPLTAILEEQGVPVLVSADRVDKAEIGFAAQEHLYCLAFTEDRQGQPTDLEVFCDDQPMLLENREIREADGLYYVPVSTFTALTGLEAVEDAAAQVITVAAPAAE